MSHENILDTINPIITKTKIPGYLSKLADIPEYQRWMKNRIGHLADATFTADAEQNKCQAICYDGTHVWAGTYYPFTLLKINPVDNIYEAVISGDINNLCFSLAFDGTYIWVGLQSKILKLNPIDNTYTTISFSWPTGYFFMYIIYDGTYVWAISDNSIGYPATIHKINPIDDTYTIITCATGEERGQGLTFDGTYIWASLGTSPFKVLKINPTDNSYTVINGTSGQNQCIALTFDGTYIWGTLNTNPVKIIKINPTNNTYTTITCATGEIAGWTMVYDGTYVLVGLAGNSPYKILKVNPTDNSYTVINGTSGQNQCYTLTFDGTYMWAGLNTNPAKIVKKFDYLRNTDSYSRKLTDVTTSRALDTTYTNSNTNRTLMILATARCVITVGSGNAYIQATSDTSTPPTTVVSGITGIQNGLVDKDNYFQIIAYVFPGCNYRIDKTISNGTVTLDKWFEMYI